MSQNGFVTDAERKAPVVPQVFVYPTNQKVSLLSFTNPLNKGGFEKPEKPLPPLFSASTPPPSPDLLVAPHDPPSFFSEYPTPKRARTESAFDLTPAYPPQLKAQAQQVHQIAQAPQIPQMPQQPSYSFPYMGMGNAQTGQQAALGQQLINPYAYLPPNYQNYQMPQMMCNCNARCNLGYMYYGPRYQGGYQGAFQRPMSFAAFNAPMSVQPPKAAADFRAPLREADKEDHHLEKGKVTEPTTPPSPLSSVDMKKLKKLFFQYFFEYPKQAFAAAVTLKEFKIVQLILIKKLVHDKRKSRVYKLIINLTPDRLMEFLHVNRPITRKNITKSCIFTKIWQVLGLKQGENFYDYYFETLVNNKHSLIYLYKHQQILKNKLWDSFYAECFLSERFKRDFMEILEDPRFKSEVIQASQRKFNKNFGSWIAKLEDFICNVEHPIDVNIRIPEFKPGITEADFDLCPALFQRIIQKLEPRNFD